MRLFERNGVYWADVRGESGRIRFSTKETKKAEARRAALKLLVGKTSELVTKVKAKELDGISKYSLEKMFDRIMDNEYRDRTHQSSIVANNRAVLDHFGSDKDIRTITQEEVSKFKDWLNTKPEYKTVSTRNKKLLALSSLLKTARESWGIAGVPSLTFKVDKQKTKRKFIYTDEQIDSVLAYFKSRGDTFMYDLTLYLSQTGKRLGEALRLNERDVRMDAGVIDVWVSKGDEPRGIPMTPAVKSMLERRKKFEGKTANWIDHQWRDMRKAVGLPDEAKIHSLRHTFATRLCEQGVDIQVVQNLLGHKQISTTTIYAKMTSKRLVDAMKVFKA